MAFCRRSMVRSIRICILAINQLIYLEEQPRIARELTSASVMFNSATEAVLNYERVYLVLDEKLINYEGQLNQSLGL